MDYYCVQSVISDFGLLPETVGQAILINELLTALLFGEWWKIIVYSE